MSNQQRQAGRLVKFRVFSEYFPSSAPLAGMQEGGAR